MSKIRNSTEGTAAGVAKFARKAGVYLVKMRPENGGPIGYCMTDSPNCTVGGFRAESSAYKHWLESTFGAQTSKAIMSLIRRAG